MTINYPDGRMPIKRRNKEVNQSPSQRVKNTFSKRGMTFEEMINGTNHYYRQRNIAIIHKKPTPIQLVKVDYPSRQGAKITEAYFKEASTTDYNGVYKGLYVDFEAKETRNKTSFPLSNFHDHQIEHIRQCLNNQGIVFVLIWFATLKRCFLLPGNELLQLWDSKSTGRKSIPLSIFEKEGTELTIGIAPIVPYIDALKPYLNKGELTYDPTHEASH